MTALTCSSSAAEWAAVRSSSCNWVFRAFIGGRSNRIVPMPSVVSSVTNSPTHASLSIGSGQPTTGKNGGVTTYYRDPDVWGGSTGVRMNGHELRLDDLIQVWHTRGRRSWGTIAGRGAVGFAILIPLVVGLLAVGGAPGAYPPPPPPHPPLR